MANYFNYAWKNLKKRRLRSWLTVIGIVIGIAAIIALISLSQGMENALTEQFSRLGSDVIQIMPANLRGPPTGDLGLPEEIISVVDRLKEVDYANPILLDFATIEYNKKKEFLFVNGYDTSLSGKGFLDADFEVEQGRLFSSGEKGAVVIGNKVAFDAFDTHIRAKNNIIIDDKKFRVIGIFESTGTDLDNRIFIAFEDAQELFERHNTINAVSVKLKPNVDIVLAQARIQKAVEKIIDEEEFELFTPEQLLNQIQGILGVMQAVLVGIAFISLLVGAIGILNAMFTSVLERTREIGIMKAIGAKNIDILMIFLVESGLIGFVGGVLGILIGIALAKGIEAIIIQIGFTLLSVRIDLNLIAVGLLFAVIIGMISGIIPAIKASKLQPVDALRYE